MPLLYCCHAWFAFKVMDIGPSFWTAASKTGSPPPPKKEPGLLLLMYCQLEKRTEPPDFLHVEPAASYGYADSVVMPFWTAHAKASPGMPPPQPLFVLSHEINSCSDSEGSLPLALKAAPSMQPTAENAQHDPHDFWSL